MQVKVKRNVSYSTTITIDGEDNDFELSQSPSSIMDCHDKFVFITENKALLGYLVDDSDCENPLTSCDGEGRVYASNRHATRESRQGFQEALGFDSDFNPRVDEDEIFNRYEAYFVANMPIADCPEKIDDRADGESDEAYLKRCAQVDFDLDKSTVIFPKALEEIRKALYLEAGNPLAVMLDVYEHSGISYSVSGEGMQDRWDTARGGAVWVPDETAKQEIEYRVIKALLPAGVSVEYLSSAEKAADLAGMDVKYTLPDGTTKAVCGNFIAGIRAAAAAMGIALDDAVIQTSMQTEASNYARSCVENYTKWCNGETYGFVIDKYVKDGNGYWDKDDSDSCYEFIGSEHALEEMNSVAKAMSESAEYTMSESAEYTQASAPRA
jgi:hypothetical protein